jgi:hypothetical protein
MTPKEMKIHFAGHIINGLVNNHGDLGGRDNDRLATEAWKLAEVMVGIYFKE